MDDGVIGAGLGALAAADALGRVDPALAVDEADGLPGAHLLAGGSQAVLAHIRDPIAIGWTDMAGVGNDVDQRRLIILPGNGGVIHALGHQAAGLDAAHGKAHGQPHPLTGNGPLQEDGLPVQRLVAGDDEKGQVLCLGIVLPGIGHPGHLGKNLFSDIGYQRRNPTHILPPGHFFLLYQRNAGRSRKKSGRQSSLSPRRHTLEAEWRGET